MLLAWQFILVWDIATLTFFLKNHKKDDLLASGLTDFFKKMSKIRKENLSLSRQKVPGIFAVHMNRQRFLSIFYPKNQKNPETKRVKYRQEVPEIFSGHMNRQRFLIKMS